MFTGKRKIIAIACIIMLAGAGCAKMPPKQVQTKPTNQTTTSTNTDQTSQPTNELEKVTFKIYYPTFTPTELKVNDSTLQTQRYGIKNDQLAVIYYLGNESTSDKPFIAIRQQSITAEQKIKKYILPGTEEISITDNTLTNLEGYKMSYKNTNNELYNTVVFKTKDNTMIRITAKQIFANLNTLVQIAESMK